MRSPQVWEMAHIYGIDLNAEQCICVICVLCRHSHTSGHVFLTNRAVKGISADTDKQVSKKRGKIQPAKEWQEQDSE